VQSTTVVVYVLQTFRERRAYSQYFTVRRAIGFLDHGLESWINDVVLEDKKQKHNVILRQWKIPPSRRLTAIIQQCCESVTNIWYRPGRYTTTIEYIFFRHYSDIGRALVKLSVSRSRGSQDIYPRQLKSVYSFNSTVNRYVFLALFLKPFLPDGVFRVSRSH